MKQKNVLVLNIKKVTVALRLAAKELSIGSVEGCQLAPIEIARRAADRDPFFQLVEIHRAVVDEISRPPGAHTLHIRREKTHHSIVHGAKTIELRRADGAFASIRAGETVTFTHTSREVKTTVTRVEHAESLEQRIHSWRRAAVPTAHTDDEAISYVAEVLSPRVPVLSIHFITAENAFRAAVMHHLQQNFANADAVTSEAFTATRAGGCKYALLAILSSRRGRILHSATNCCTGTSSAGGHAERQVLDGYLESDRRLPRACVRNLTLTVLRFDAKGSLAMARPCAECCKRIRRAAAHVKRVRWSTGCGEDVECCNSKCIEGTPTRWMQQQMSGHMPNGPSVK